MKFWWWYGSRQKFVVYKWEMCIQNRRLSLTLNEWLRPSSTKKYDWHTQKARASALLHVQTDLNTYTDKYAHTKTRATMFSASFKCPPKITLNGNCWRNQSTLHIGLFVCVRMFLLWWWWWWIDFYWRKPLKSQQWTIFTSQFSISLFLPFLKMFCRIFFVLVMRSFFANFLRFNLCSITIPGHTQNCNLWVCVCVCRYNCCVYCLCANLFL